MATFRDFILAAANDKDLAGGFWKIVTQPDFYIKQAKDYVEGAGYTVEPADVESMRDVKILAEKEWDFIDRSY